MSIGETIQTGQYLNIPNTWDLVALVPARLLVSPIDIKRYPI